MPIFQFESRVVLDGSQTFYAGSDVCTLFESRVVLDGSQTVDQRQHGVVLFESRVVLDGSQTIVLCAECSTSLRVVLF